MNDEPKSRKALLKELAALRQRVSELESTGAEQQFVENTLRESQERLRTLMTIAPVGIFLTDPQGRCHYVNQRWCEMAGISLAQALDEGWMERLHPDDRQRVTDAWEKMVQAEGQWELEYRFLSPEGNVTWVLGRATALRDARGRISGYIGINIDITERKQAEENLRESQQSYRRLIETCPNSIGFIDLEGKLALCNQQTATLYGYESPKDLIGKFAFEFIAPQDRDAARASLEQALAGREIHDVEYEMLKRDGTPFYARISGSLVTDAAGQPLGIIAITQDISEHRRAEQALRESEERYRSTIDALNALIHVVDRELRFVLFNQKMRETLQQLGISKDPIGQHLFEIFTFLPDKVRQEYEKVFETGQMQTTQEATQIGQQERWSETRKIPIFDSTGTPFRVITIVHDITEHKQAEQAVRESELKFRSLVDQAAEMLYLHDLDGNILDVNQAAVTHTGYTKSELLQLKTSDIDPDYVEREDQGRFWDNLTADEPLIFEARHQRKDGSIFPVEVTLGKVELGDDTYLLALVSDITERKRAEEKLQQYAADLERSNQELEQVATIISHDLREPLRMVTGHLRLLAQDYSDRLDTTGQESINYAIDGAIRMQAMIQDLLTYARVGTRDRSLQPVDCEVSLEQALMNLQVAIQESNAEISHDPLPTVMVDDVEMTQLFQNLISNAIKFRGEPPPQVNVSAKQEEQEWLFSVRDNGIGIDPVQSERIFQVFQRLHTKEEYPGTGMGLAICKKIVERHGGRIWVESEPEQGSTFYFTLAKR